MTATIPAPAGHVADAASDGPADGSRWRRARGWLLVAVAVVLALAVAVWTARDGQAYPEPLDPQNPGSDGARAVAQVLEDEGVELTVARSADQLEDTAVDGDTTVVVTSTSRLSPTTLERLRTHATPGRLVLVEPSYALVQEIREDPTVAPVFDEVEAACSRPVDGVDLSGLTIEVDQATAYRGQGCFPVGSGAVVTADDAAGVVLLGAGQALSNDQVLRADNAAVALRLLGADRRLVWYVPDPADATSDEAVSLGTLLPDWIEPGLWMTGLAAAALVYWRFRRLGPLSTEPLPVVVRAVETARSRGRMYRKSGDRAHAAEALRRATTTELATRLRLDRRAHPASVAQAVAHHLGRRAEEIDALLTGAPPTSDRELVRLGQELARLRNEVRHR